jgi:adapter protein MecA 1/2
MKIEKVNENIIRVAISLNDLDERNIDFSSLNYNSPAAQELFWDMMEMAESQFGFTAQESQLIFEAWPDSNEGYIVTITKVEENDDFESIHKFIKNKYKNSDLKAKRKSRKICSTVIIYSFKTIDDLVDLSKRLFPIYTGESSVYTLNDLYYLVLTRNTSSQSTIAKWENIMNEYGTKIYNINIYEGYLCEYGKIMFDRNALKIINTFY